MKENKPLLRLPSPSAALLIALSYNGYNSSYSFTGKIVEVGYPETKSNRVVNLQVLAMRKTKLRAKSAYHEFN